MVFHDDNCWMHQPIGPSPERQLEEQKKALRREGDRIIAAVKRIRSKTADFKAKYGDDLATYGLLYAERTKPGHHLFVSREGLSMRVPEVRPLFVKALLAKLSEIPESDQEQWLTIFFEELDHF